MWTEDGLDGAKVLMLIGYLTSTPQFGDISNAFSERPLCDISMKAEMDIILLNLF